VSVPKNSPAEPDLPLAQHVPHGDAAHTSVPPPGPGTPDSHDAPTETSVASQVMVLMFTDVVDSVALKTRLGDRRYSKMLARHNELLTRATAGVKGTEFVNTAGDGVLSRHRSASAAVEVALAFQSALADEKWEGEPLLVRTGIHVGEALEVRDVRGHPNLSGLAVDLAARVMSLAMPGQVLLTRTAFDDARQYLRADTGHSVRTDIQWLAHGPYKFKGADEPTDVYEVGTIGKAPLTPPKDSEKAVRSVRVEDAELLGWRPAPGLPVPGQRAWIIKKKLGQGGFGEVWLAEHESTRHQHVLKFCFDADKLRFLRRELTLFRLLSENLGNRPDIVRILNVRLDKAPNYLEQEYAEHGNMEEWAVRRGGKAGLSAVPLQERLAVMARVCDAVGAAHGVGILHKDLKPANVLMYKVDEHDHRPRLADFGIGGFADARYDGHSTMKMGGFTLGGATGGQSSSTGTPMYMPPEVLAGHPFTMQGDVFALGVMLYQMVVGDLRRPLGVGWERDVQSPELREDIRRAVAASPAERFTSAEALARHLRTLDERRRLRRRKRFLRVSAIAAAATVVVVAGTVWVVRERQARREAEALQVQANEARQRAEKESSRAKALNQLLDRMLDESDPRVSSRQIVTDETLLDAACVYFEQLAPGRDRDQADALAAAAVRLGRTALGISKASLALKPLYFATQHRREAAPNSVELADALHWLACAQRDDRKYEAAQATFAEALQVWGNIGSSQDAGRAGSLYELGVCLRQMGSANLDKSEELVREALIIWKRCAATSEIRAEVARAHNSLARTLAERGKWLDAKVSAEESLALRRDLFQMGHRDVARSVVTVGQIAREMGEFALAHRYFEQARKDFERFLGERNSEATGATIESAVTYLAEERPVDAEWFARQAMEQRTEEAAAARDAKRSDWRVAEPRILLGLALIRSPADERARGEALKLLSAAVEGVKAEWEGKNNPNHWQLAFARGALGEALLAAGDLAAAEPHLRHAARVWIKERRSPHRTRAAIQNFLRWCDERAKTEPLTPELKDEAAACRAALAGLAAPGAVQATRSTGP
jgi:serine/threonine-protein kinase